MGTTAQFECPVPCFDKEYAIYVKQRNRSNKERKYLHPVLGPMNLSTLPVKDIKGELTMI
jgi:hypothetical protein